MVSLNIYKQRKYFLNLSLLEEWVLELRMGLKVLSLNTKMYRDLKSAKMYF